MRVSTAFMPGSAVEAVRELPGDRERDCLLARAGLADRAWVFAAVAGIDRDDEVALPVAGRHLDGLRRLFVAEVDDEPVSVGFIWRSQESLGFDSRVDVEDDSKAGLAALAEAHGLHDACATRRLQRLQVSVDPVEIDDDSLGA